MLRGVKMDELLPLIFLIFVGEIDVDEHNEINLYNSIIVSYRLSLINSIKHYSLTQLYKCIDRTSLPFVVCTLFKGFA